jgi:hypothetical protein
MTSLRTHTLSDTGECQSAQELGRYSNRSQSWDAGRAKEGSSLSNQCVGIVSVECAGQWALPGGRRHTGHERGGGVYPDRYLPASERCGSSGGFSSPIGKWGKRADASKYAGIASGTRHRGPPAKWVFSSKQGIFVAHLFGPGITAGGEPDQRIGRVPGKSKMTLGNQYRAFRESGRLVWTMSKSPARIETSFSVPGPIE